MGSVDFTVIRSSIIRLSLSGQRVRLGHFLYVLRLPTKMDDTTL